MIKELAKDNVVWKSMHFNTVVGSIQRMQQLHCNAMMQWQQIFSFELSELLSESKALNALTVNPQSTVALMTLSMDNDQRGFFCS